MRRLLGLLLAATFAFVPATAASAATPPSDFAVAPAVGPIVHAESFGVRPVVIVLDLSGSMNDDDGTGTNKLSAAKSAVERVIRSQAANSEIGVWGYPGVASDCDAGSYLIPPSRISDPALAIATVDAMTASGGTPTGKALSGAVEGLKAQGYTQATIILVSDGESNCSSPPCPVAEQLVGTGFDVTVDAVGFQQSGQGKDELQCVADATRGRYIDVDDGQSLIDGLDELATARLSLDVQYPSEAPTGYSMQITMTATNASSKPATNVKANLAFDGKLGGLMPAVIPPTVSLGTIPANSSVPYTWTVSTGVKSKSTGDAAFTVTAWGEDVGAVSSAGRVALFDKQYTKGDVASRLWMKDDKSKIVILGDSYSSGEGTRDYYDKNNKCHQSNKTYVAPLVSDRIKVIACSGAVTGNLYTTQNTDSTDKVARPQLEQLKEVDNIGAVLMTFGGNDIGFADVLGKCAVPENCAANAKWMTAVSESVAGLAQTLPNAYRDIWKTANSEELVKKRGGALAPVVVLAYPEILHESSRGACDMFNAEEVEFAHRLVTALNAGIKKAVSDVRDEGYEVYFAASTQSAFLPSNTTCEDGDAAFVNGILLNPAPMSESYHPKVSGYEATTKALMAWLSTIDRVQPTAKPTAARNDSWLDGFRSWINTDRSKLWGPVDGALQIGNYLADDFRDTFAPRSGVTVTLHSEPVTLGTFTTAEDGTFPHDLWIPEFVPPGEHTLTLSGFDKDDKFVELSIPITIVDPLPKWLDYVALGTAIALLLAIASTVWGIVRAIRTRRKGAVSV